jgi:hypothetical protein
LKWDQRQVVAESTNPTGCRVVTLTINTASNEVDEVDRNGSVKGCQIGNVQVPKLDKPRVSRLVDGLLAARPYFEKKRKDASETLSADYTLAAKKILEGIK